jgi:phosphopantothenoylcysteine decarboxylase/phosphopantothenate--cysteine ligase
MTRKPVILITAGPTREYIDPVRYISNASSGKMGYALAEAARKAGAEVILISGPVEFEVPRGVACVHVTSAREMLAAAREHVVNADIVIGAAAVSDYRPRATARHKMKKSNQRLTLELVPNPDILATLSRHKGSRIFVGFALESKDLISSAMKKLVKKNLDLIVANYPEAIGSDTSSVWLVDTTGRARAVKNTNKKLTAEKIINEALRIRKNHTAG